MKFNTLFLLAIASVVLLASVTVLNAKEPQISSITAKTKGAISGISTITAVATVQEVNKETRQVTLKKETGEIITITAPQEVRNFTQINVGDLVTTKYSSSFDIKIVKGSSEEVGYVAEEIVSRAKLGDKPGGVTKITVAFRANIIKANPETQVVTLEGKENVLDIKVDDADDFKAIHVGDQVEAITTKSMAISVTAMPKDN